MAFDQAGAFYVAASHGGRKGIFRFLPDGSLQQVVSGPGIVGLAFLRSREMVVATGSNLYRLDASWLKS
jgi:sugar lactone lactonase YvrE